MKIIGINNNINNSLPYKQGNINMSAKPVFKSNSSNLINKMQLRDTKIKEFLLEIIEKEQSFSMREIAENLGFKNISSISKRIYQNPDIKELWDKVMVITAQKSKDIDQRIKRALELAVESQNPISAKEIANTVGINHAACRRRIYINPELKEIFDKRIEKPRCVKSVEALNIEEQIKQILENAIQNNEPISSKIIAERLGLKTSQIQDRIKRNPVLKALWNKFEHSKTPRKSQKTIENSNKLRAVLENAQKNHEYLTLADITRLTGFTESAILHRLSRNPELKEIWKKVNKTNISMQANFDKIRETLLYAIRTKTYMTIADISKHIGMETQSVKSRFSYSPELKGLWMQVMKNNKNSSIHSERIKEAKRKTKTIMTPDESKEINELLRFTLETAIKNNTPLNVEIISNNLGISKAEVTRRANQATMKSLWEQCKHITAAIEEEKTNKIAEYLTKAAETGTVLTISDASKAFGMKQYIFTGIIYKTPHLKALWNQIEHNGGNIKSSRTIEENKQIIDIMRTAIINNQALLLDDIAKEIGLSVAAIKGRIKSYPEVKGVWDNVQRKKIYIEPKESLEKTEKIKSAIEKYISLQKPFMLFEIAKELKMNTSSLYLKVNRTPILKELWKSAEKSFISEDSAGINKKIRDVLLDSIEKGEYINAKMIAKKVKVTYPTCIQRMDENGELRALWEEVKKLRVDDFEAKNKVLEDILRNSIKKNIPLTIPQIIEHMELSENSFDYRIANSAKLKSLWSQVKTIDAKIMKEINRLSVKEKLSYEEIKQKLNLDNEQFNELMLRYERIKTYLSKRINPIIKDEDILSWAVLSKREFELAVREIFEKMGYSSKTTRYKQDKGVDIIASKDNKVTCIECMHNLRNATDLEELLALQANKYYINADNVIYVASSGINDFGKKYVDKLGKFFKILELEDLITAAKKHKIDINNLKEKDEYKITTPVTYGGSWKFASKKKPEEVFEWRKLRHDEFDKRIAAIFKNKGYYVKKADELNLEGYYVLYKNNKRTVIKCHNSNTMPTIDEVKALYGLKDYYDAEDVILIAPSSISLLSKDFIDKINSDKRTKNSYKLLSIDKVIDLYNLIRK